MYIRWYENNIYQQALACPDMEKLIVEVHEDLNQGTTRFLKVLKVESRDDGVLRIFVDTSKEEVRK